MVVPTVVVTIVISLVLILGVIGVGPDRVPGIHWYAHEMATHWEKVQGIRILDVLVLGPVGIWLGLTLWRGEPIPEWVPLALVVYGVGTIVYNLGNYLKNAER